VSSEELPRTTLLCYTDAVMPSRRARKRYRRLDAEASLRGDRTSPPAEDLGFAQRGFGGGLCGEWESASPSDLALLRQAIREGWPVPQERRPPLLEAVLSPLHSKDRSPRQAIALARLLLFIDRHNRKLDCAEPKSAFGKVSVEDCLYLAAEEWASMPRS